MNNTNEEITFAQIFAVMKKSFARAIIYMLISVMLVLTTLFTAKELTTYQTSQTVIWVSEESKITLDDVNYHKATAVQRAIEEFNGESQPLASSVLSALSVNAIVPANLDEKTLTEFVPNSFTLSLSGKDLPDLSPERLNALLDTITIKLLNTLALSELPKLEITNSLSADLQVLEYFQIADQLYTQTKTVYGVIENQLASKPNVSEYVNPDNGYALTDLLGNINSILAKIENLKTYIISNRIENVNGLESILNVKKIEMQTLYDSYDTQATKALDVLTNFPSSSANLKENSGTSVVVDNESYENLARIYYNLLDLRSSADRENNKYNEYITTIQSLPVNTDQSKIAYTENALAQIYTELNTSLADYKTLAKDYNQNYFSNQEAKVINPSHTIKISKISSSIILLVTVITALIAYLVAFLQAYSKSNKVRCYISNEELPTEVLPVKE